MHTIKKFQNINFLSSDIGGRLFLYKKKKLNKKLNIQNIKITSGNAISFSYKQIWVQSLLYSNCRNIVSQTFFNYTYLHKIKTEKVHYTGGSQPIFILAYHLHGLNIFTHHLTFFFCSLKMYTFMLYV